MVAHSLLHMLRRLLTLHDFASTTPYCLKRHRQPLLPFLLVHSPISDLATKSMPGNACIKLVFCWSNGCLQGVAGQTSSKQLVSVCADDALMPLVLMQMVANKQELLELAVINM